MLINKNTKLTPIQRIEIAQLRWKENARVCDLCRKFNVFRPTICKIINHAKLNDYSIHKSVNNA